MVRRKQAEGHHRFKLKVGFGAERDLRNVAALRALLGDSGTLCVDANHAWTLDEALAQGALAVLQPDAAKWGGISGCLPIGRAALGAGRRYCPHYLGAGVGLLASAHLLSAVGGDGWLEIDSNDNPLRDALCGPVAKVVEGRIELSEAAGLGIRPDLERLEPIRSFC